MIRNIFEFDHKRELSLDLADVFHYHFHFSKYLNVGKTLKLCWLFVIKNNKTVLIFRDDPFELMIHQLDILKCPLKLILNLNILVW